MVRKVLSARVRWGIGQKFRHVGSVRKVEEVGVGVDSGRIYGYSRDMKNTFVGIYAPTVPSRLRLALKVYAARQGTTMARVIVAALAEYLERRGVEWQEPEPGEVSLVVE